MARTARDCALMLDAMAGEHREDLLSLPLPARSFRASMSECPAPRRVAFSRDLGLVPVDPEVAALCEQAAHRFEAMGASVEEACPDLGGAIDCFQTLRAHLFAADHAGHLAAHRALLKDDVVWNIEKGLALDGAALAAAEAARMRILAGSLRFFERYDLLLCPAAIVAPFGVETRYVEEVAGQRFENYVHWLAITFAVTLTGCPAASVPAGLTGAGLPVGLQIIGPRHRDDLVLQVARAYEQIRPWNDQWPDLREESPL